MAGFDASSIVEPLKFTLRPFADVEGTIAEPTSLQVEKFFADSRKEQLRAMREARELGLVPDDADSDEEMTPAQLEKFLEALAKIDPRRTAAARKRSAEILSALCSGQPTTGQLLELPLRILREFSAWIQGEVLSPEVSPGAGKPQLEIVRSSAAG
jgi:hypothetical protein